MNAQGAVNWVRGDLPVELVGAFAGARRVAWDVETTGLDWRRDRVATCQIFMETAGVVIISVTGERPARLLALLEDPAVEKVFHHQDS